MRGHGHTTGQRSTTITLHKQTEKHREEGRKRVRGREEGREEGVYGEG